MLIMNGNLMSKIAKNGIYGMPYDNILSNIRVEWGEAILIKFDVTCITILNHEIDFL